MDKLDKFSLELDDYSSLVEFLGKVTKIDHNVISILSDEGIELDFIFHPDVIDMLDEEGVVLFEDDVVDILGVYVLIDGAAKILVIRCVVYETPPSMVC